LLRRLARSWPPRPAPSRPTDWSNSHSGSSGQRRRGGRNAAAWIRPATHSSSSFPNPDRLSVSAEQEGGPSLTERRIGWRARHRGGQPDTDSCADVFMTRSAAGWSSWAAYAGPQATPPAIEDQRAEVLALHGPDGASVSRRTVLSPPLRTPPGRIGRRPLTQP